MLDYGNIPITRSENHAIRPPSGTAQDHFLCNASDKHNILSRFAFNNATDFPPRRVVTMNGL